MRYTHLYCFFGLFQAFLSAGFGQITAISPKKATRAVVVGISTYEKISSLRFAHRDAQAFADYLKSPEGGNVPPEQIKLLTNQEATQGKIVAALTWLMEESQPGDFAIFFFSGHGDAETVLTDMGYLLTYEANKAAYSAGGAIAVVTLQSFLTKMAVQKEVQMWVIADACRSGQLAGASANGTKAAALALAGQFANEVKILSCQPNELSLESEEWGGGRSVFSYFLVDGLQGKADANEDRQITLREIERYLEDNVQRATAAIRTQTPMALGDKNKVLGKVAPKAAPPVSGATPGEVSAPTARDSSPESLLREFDAALKKGDLLSPVGFSAYDAYKKAAARPDMQAYRNAMRNDLVSALQDEAQRAINDYLSADPREMRRRWALDDSRYGQYPRYLAKAAELLGESHFSYKPAKAKELYFSGLNLRLQGERSGSFVQKDSLYAEAIVLQRAVLALDSSAAYAYNEMGLLARRQGKYAESVRYFERAVWFSPTWVLPWTNLCDSHNELGDQAAALRAGEKAVALDSGFAMAHYNLGYAYWVGGDWEKAANCYQKTIDLSPDYANAYFNLGLYHAHRQNYPQAEALMRSYVAKMPNDPDGYNNLGEICDRLGKHDEAREHLLKALALNPSHATTNLSLGEHYQRLKDWDSATKWYAEYARLTPENPEAQFRLALVRHQQPKAALGHLEAAFKQGFKDTERLNQAPELTALRKTASYKALMSTYFPK